MAINPGSALKGSEAGQLQQHGPGSRELYELFDKGLIGELSWRPNKPLQWRLSKSDGEYDKAAHDEYLILMNNRAPLLVTETIQLLVDLAEVATRNQNWGILIMNKRSHVIRHMLTSLHTLSVSKMRFFLF